MGRLKGAGPQPLPLPGEPPLLGEPSHVELDLESHKAAIEAKFSEIQIAFESFCNQQSQFRTDILDKLRQLQIGSKAPVDQGDSNPLQFGTLPPAPNPLRTQATSNVSGTVVISDVVARDESTSTETRERRVSSGFPLNLSHHEIVLSLNSELNVGNDAVGNSSLVATSGVMVCREKSAEIVNRRVVPQNRASGNENLSSSNTQYHHLSPRHYYQHTDLGSIPFNSFVGSVPYMVQNQGYLPQHPTSNTTTKAYDPYMMTYSGPYHAFSATVPNLPIPSLPFAVSAYLNAQAQPFAPPAFATTTTPTQS